MAHQTDLLTEWLEGEGERQRRWTPLPPRVGDPAVRGWVHVGICVLIGILTARLLGFPGRPNPFETTNFRVGQPTILAGVRVERIDRDVQLGGGPGPLTLVVTRGRWIGLCRFRKEKAPRDVRVGDIVNLRGVIERIEEDRDRVVLKACEVVTLSQRRGFGGWRWLPKAG
jgi:hypothetical protein